LLVFCVVSTNSLTMAAVGVIRRRHLPDGGIQWRRRRGKRHRHGGDVCVCGIDVGGLKGFLELSLM
jgi:hypothetical protein